MIYIYYVLKSWCPLLSAWTLISPSALIEPSTVISESPTVEGEQPSEDEPEDEMFEEATCENEDQELPEDNVEDRDFTHEFVGKKINALYGDGWAVGDIVYYNSAIDRLKVMFDEDTDLIAPYDIDGVEVQLV